MKHVSDLEVPANSLVKLLIELLLALVSLGRGHELRESAHVLLDHIHNLSLLLIERLDGRVDRLEFIDVLLVNGALLGLPGVDHDQILNGIEILALLEGLLKNLGPLILDVI